MKKTILCFIFLLALVVGCQKDQAGGKITQPSLSNLANEKSLQFVSQALKENLIKEGITSQEDLDTFLALVQDYNESVGKEKLLGDFQENLQPDYDTGKLIEARQKNPGKYPDTNCRITAFLLAKDGLKAPQEAPMDDNLLFMDEEKIQEGKLFTHQDFEKFKQFFSRIPTVNSKDPKAHGKVLEAYYKDWTFPENAHLLALVLHDKLDGNYLFIGHIGLLMKIQGRYLFLEKISFEEPYQAIQFPTKEACYKYLKEKFKDYTDPDTAPPFLMDNGHFVE